MTRHVSPDHANESDPDQLLDERAAARLLSYSVRALQNWRVRGGGPRFVRVSKRSIRYRRRDLLDWAESRIVSNTSESPIGSEDEFCPGGAGRAAGDFEGGRTKRPIGRRRARS